VIPLAGLLEGPTTEPTVVITFDDGFRSVYENALPRLRDLGLTAVCYLTTDVIGNQRLIWINELNWFFHHQSAVARPIIFEFVGMDPTCPHAVVMRRLVDSYNPTSIAGLLDQLRSASSVEPAECRAEISRASEAIAHVAGATKTMAYPFGTTTEATRRIAIELGIQALVGVHGVNYPFDRTRIGRIKVGSFSAAVLFARMEVVEPIKTWLKRRLRPASPPEVMTWEGESRRAGTVGNSARQESRPPEDS
jgi:peptidoglycan/xylan/chitin deacetylase (PgdA/CDA1 family)